MAARMTRGSRSQPYSFIRAPQGRNLRELADELESVDGLRDPRPCLIAVDGKPG